MTPCTALRRGCARRPAGRCERNAGEGIPTGRQRAGSGALAAMSALSAAHCTRCTRVRRPRGKPVGLGEGVRRHRESGIGAAGDDGMRGRSSCLHSSRDKSVSTRACSPWGGGRPRLKDSSRGGDRVALQPRRQSPGYNPDSRCEGPGRCADDSIRRRPSGHHRSPGRPTCGMAVSNGRNRTRRRKYIATCNDRVQAAGRPAAPRRARRGRFQGRRGRRRAP
jgi:hypothetical protein